MDNIRKQFAAVAILLLAAIPISAQQFFNLGPRDTRIDSALPYFTHSVQLPDNYADSIYTVSIKYPEFVDLTKDEVRRLLQIGGEQLPALPQITQHVVVERKRGKLEISFVPLVFQGKKYQRLVHFMLDIKSSPLKRSVRRRHTARHIPAAERYASNSVLAHGKWAKIRVPQTGIYQLTADLVKRAGFSDLNKVKIYGYGGALQNEQLVPSELMQLDDLKEVATCVVDGKRLFHAKGPVSWSAPDAVRRTRNPYSTHGYYFITESDTSPLTMDSEQFLNSFYPSADDYHSLHEIDNYAWFHGGRNLFENTPINLNTSKTYEIATPGDNTSGQLSIGISAGGNSRVQIELNGDLLGVMDIILGNYDKGNATYKNYQVNNLTATNNIRLSTISGGPVRLDYISLAVSQPKNAPQLSGTTFPTPEYVYNITQQNLHAHTPVDMTIIIPTSQKLLSEAQRLKAFHEQHDNMSVRIVPADEIFNEFSSGTPDANAYRRYMKMLYDRATTEEEMPKYLVLFGDCVWDNRMLTSDCSNFNPDDYLLCFESENSFNEVFCYVDDGFFCLLDDNEGIRQKDLDKLDIAVGRFPVTTPAEAKTMVDKIIRYATNKEAGAWQNTIMIMGDDGNGNLHMRQAYEASLQVERQHPEYLVKRIMWDSYTRESSSTGNSYPEVERLIKQQQADGALIMDYVGHGQEIGISHERVLTLNDFQNFNNANLPLWITASCDIMPFDGSTNNIGEMAVLNQKGGAIAFFGTTRTVFANYNRVINMAFLEEVLKVNNGRRTTLGEAQMRAKNSLVTTLRDTTENKLQYSLLGDPALALNLPTYKMVIDSINGISVNQKETIQLKAGSIAHFSGHIEYEQVLDEQFNGTMSAVVRDTEERIVCKLNDTSNDGATKAFTYYDRPKTLYSGSNQVKDGRFSFEFAVPMDINYADAEGQVNLHAVSSDYHKLAHGYSTDFLIGGSADNTSDQTGPSIFCYLNSSSFINGDKVNPTPYFVAEISDKDGINAAGSGIGHDLELIVDGDMTRTYILNNYFTFDFGSYTSGKAHYQIPELPAGPHKLMFRAWDVLNNPSVSELSFNVVRGLAPNVFDVTCTTNPATTSTSFIITHDRTNSPIDIELDIFDASGRLLWKRSENGVSAGNTYTMDWDLCIDGGNKLKTGVYLYRVSMSCDGSKKISKAKKLIIIGNK